MKAYLDLMDVSMDYLDKNMCWDFRPDKDMEEIDAEMAFAWLGYDSHRCIGGNHTPSSTMLAAVVLYEEEQYWR